MVILYSIVLFLMGIQASASIIADKPKSLVPLFDGVSKYKERIGVAGLLLSVVYGISLLDKLGNISTMPSQFFLGLFSSLIAFGLGLVFGYDAVCNHLKDTTGGVHQKLDRYRQFVMRHQIPVGLVGAALGVLTFIANI